MTEKGIQYLTSSSDGTKIAHGDLINVLEVNAKNYPDKVLFYFLEDGENESMRITYREMQASVKSIAGGLQHQFNKGDRALLLFSPGIEFIISLFACIYSGIIPVPAYPPRKNRNFSRFVSILDNSEPAFIFTTGKIKNDILKNFEEEPSLTRKEYVVFEEIIHSSQEKWIGVPTDPDDIALLQFTSGSTDSPHGVMISHKNILHNSEFIKIAFGHDEHLQGVNWLPGFHDMGLIGALIQPVYVGGSNVILPPNAFLMRPHRWFHAVTKFRGTTIGGPNFALDYCADRIKDEEVDGVDLSTVKPFYCGSEPIRKSSIERFNERFGQYGFSFNSLYPCYGLAEATLIVTGGDLDAEPVYFPANEEKLKRGVVEREDDARKANVLTGCGYPMIGTKVIIVDPETLMPCNRGKIGEIWVSGPSVARGYWNDPEGTERTFRAFATTGEGPFMRTGDLGFIEDGQLFISGRLKDLIIIRGLNHYPQDIEQTTEEAHEAIQHGSTAAFSVEHDHQESLVVVAEVKRTHLRDLDHQQVIEAIRKAIAENHGLEPLAIVLTRTGSTPKTSSGKIQRFECRNQFLDNSLQEVASWQREETRHRFTSHEIEKWLINWIASEMKIDPSEIREDKLITSYGIGSLAAVKMARDAEDAFGIEWPLDLFFEEDITVGKLKSEAVKLLAGD